MSKTYDFNDSTQLSPHFNIREFRCKCGKEHETLNSPELVEKLEKLYEALDCSKIIVTSGYRCEQHDKNVGGTARDSTHSVMRLISATTGRTDSLSTVKSFAARHRISVSEALPISPPPTSIRMWMCVIRASGTAMRCMATVL